MTMRISVIGSTNGNYNKLNELLNECDGDLHVILGDLAIYKDCKFDANESCMKYKWEYKLPMKPSLFICGRYDDGSLLNTYNNHIKNNIYKINKNLYYLPIGGSYYYMGLRIASLGGIYSAVTYFKQREQLKGNEKVHYTAEDIIQATNLEDIDILFTYEPPSPFLRVKGNRVNNIGRNEITSLLYHIQPKLHIFSDRRKYKEFNIGRTHCISIPDNDRYEFDIGELL